MKNNYYKVMDIISKEAKNENLRQQLAVCKEFIAWEM